MVVMRQVECVGGRRYAGGGDETRLPETYSSIFDVSIL